MVSVNFVFCIHNHQPVDNFDSVFEQATRDSYLPFLEVVERHPKIRLCAHYSGPLLEWLSDHRPEVLEKLSGLVRAGRLELLGGGFYEPIFTMLPEQDAAGQIEMNRRYLRDRFGADPRGLWLPERVWEPQLASVFARAGVEYTVLDDFHFRAAGLRDDELDRAFVTEDQGNLCTLFPLREGLRYAIPYQDPRATIDYLLSRASESGDRVVVYADDGEKFGVWPRTRKHVFEDGWLERFFRALEEVSDRIRMITFSEALDGGGPKGRVHLPSCSYREMGEWSLLSGGQADYQEAQRRMESARHMVPGGTWRNFRVKYPEANLMYGRMLSVSRRLAGFKGGAADRAKACKELYKGQCNCGYWHGVFGGLYLSHLRGSIYRHLIAADRILDDPGKTGMRNLDLDLDGRPDVQLFNPEANIFLLPAVGGRIAEFDYKRKQLNLTATLARRPEAYHAKVREAGRTPGETVVSIHDVAVSKSPDLDRYLAYDSHPRATLVDHFFDPDSTPSTSNDVGDFAVGEYQLRTSDHGGVVRAELRREGRVRAVPLVVEKVVSLDPHAARFTALYRLEARAPLRAVFGIEFNVALLSPEVSGATVRSPAGDVLGSLGEAREFRGLTGLFVHDLWHGLRIGWSSSAQATFDVFPVYTVSQSESGFERSYQGTAITPYWQVDLKPGQPWVVQVEHWIGEAKP